MNAKKTVKEYERALRLEPENLVLRLKLASALREVGRHDDAVAMYRSVAVSYHLQGRLVQAMAVCKSVLEFDPGQPDLRALLLEIDAARTGAPQEEPTQLAADKPVAHNRRIGADDRTPPKIRVGITREPPPRMRRPTEPPEEDPWALHSLPDDDRRAMLTPAATRELDSVDDELDHDPEDMTNPSDEARLPRLPTGLGEDEALRLARHEPPVDLSMSANEPTTLQAVPEPAPADGHELIAAFDRPYSNTIDQLGPDGSTIEQPLSIFSDLPQAAQYELAQRLIVRRFTPGAVIVREGDAGESCFVVQAGSVRVLKKDPSGVDQFEVVRLGPGALFGEFALLADRRRHATVQALEDCELYEIPRRLLRELAATYPGVNPALERLYRERLVSTLITSAPFFAPLPLEERGSLMARFVPCRVEAGGTVVREGEPGGGLYLVVLGTVEITKVASNKRGVLLGTLGEGAYFGEMSLLRGTVASATVTAHGPVELAQLPPKDFYAVMSTYPVLWEELRREAKRRELANQNILAGDTNLV